MVGKDDPGVDIERCTGARSTNRVAQRADARHQQVRPTVKQVHCKEERSTRNSIAAIIWHEGSMPELRFRRNALRFPPYAADLATLLTSRFLISGTALGKGFKLGPCPAIRASRRAKVSRQACSSMGSGGAPRIPSDATLLHSSGCARG